MIILIDTTEFKPENCSGCKRFCARKKETVKGTPTDRSTLTCIALEKPITDPYSALPDCPIKYIPARMHAQGDASGRIDDYHRGLVDGWNTCVDCIERD